MTCLRRLLVALLLASAGVGAARAEDVQIAAFYGRYEGTAITEKLEGLYYGIGASDIDVEIGQTSAGFFIQWTAVNRDSADPSDLAVRRVQTRLEFVPSGHSGTYHPVGTAAEIGAAFAWATVSGQTLRIQLVDLDEHGGFELQTYERTLTDLGITLEFSRVRNGEQVLFLRGRTIKVAH